MATKRADVVVGYPGQPKVVASVSTTPDMLILSLGDGRQEHYTYPPDGHFHITTNDGSSRSFFAPGPAYAELDYHRFAIITVPVDSKEIVRAYKPKNASVMTIAAPVEREGILEVGVMGQMVTPSILAELQSDGATVASFQGPRSGTTIVFRYTR